MGKLRFALLVIEKIMVHTKISFFANWNGADVKNEKTTHTSSGFRAIRFLICVTINKAHYI